MQVSHEAQVERLHLINLVAEIADDTGLPLIVLEEGGRRFCFAVKSKDRPPTELSPFADVRTIFRWAHAWWTGFHYGSSKHRR